MAVLSDLPPELLLEIVGYLCTDSCRKLALCSRYLCDFARTSLFREITLGWDKDGNQDPSESPLEFLRFIIENPAVRRGIREIRGALDDEYDEYVDGTLNCDVEVPRDEVVNVVDSLVAKKAGSGTDSAAYARALEALARHAAFVGMQNGIVLLGGFMGRLVLLMHYLPLVTSLRLNSRCPCHTFFALAIQGRLSGGLPLGFSSLTKIHVLRSFLDHREGSDVPTHYGIPRKLSCNCLDLLFALFALPSLRTLHASGFLGVRPVAADHPPGPTPSPNAISNQASPLKTLIFDNSHITLSTLRHISFIPHGLVDFVMRGLLPPDVGAEDCISELLDNHTATLRTLTMTYHKSNGGRPVIPYRLGSLVNFAALEELTLDYRAVQSQFDHDARAGFPIHSILPPSLVILCIKLCDYAPWNLPEFTAKTSMPQYWAQEKTHFLTLKAFYVDSPDYRHGTDLYVAEKDFKACGVYLRQY